MVQRILQGLLGTVAVFLLGSILLYVTPVRPIHAQDFTNFSNLRTDQFTLIDLSDAAMCSDGSDYHIYARRGTSDNLIIFFAGGGACWNADTCAVPIVPTDFNGFYFPIIWDFLVPFVGGIFQQNALDNPFADWNAVYLPYCTADFHVGTSSPTYTRADDEPFTIHHNGWQNVTEALDWVYATVPNPPKLLVAGESAGAFGSILWTPHIASHYEDAQIYALADGAYLQADWTSILQAWGADFDSFLAFPIHDDLTGDAYAAYAAAPAPNVTWLQINTAYDGTLLYFNSVLAGEMLTPAYLEAWSRAMRRSMANVANSGLDYAYYLTDYGLSKTEDTTPHTSISQPLFYQIEQDSTRLIDWIRGIVLDDNLVNVGEGLAD